MADNLSIDRRTSALLVMDFQTLIVDNYAAGAEALLDRTAKLIAVARTAGMRVIYVVVGFRPGYPEVSDRNATFNGSRPRAYSPRVPKMRRSIPPSRRWPRKSSSPSIG
jgi:nicotinamidase-related amidase